MHSSLPPYHPDYEPPANGDTTLYYASEDSSSSSDEYVDQHVRDPLSIQTEKVRRGSEGYEVRPVNREELLRQYIEEQAQEEGRYHRYVPEPDTNSEEDEEEGEEYIPLGKTVESWRAGMDPGLVQ